MKLADGTGLAVRDLNTNERHQLGSARDAAQFVRGRGWRTVERFVDAFIDPTDDSWYYRRFYNLKIDDSMSSDAQWRNGTLFLNETLFGGWDAVVDPQARDAPHTFAKKIWLAAILTHEMDHLGHRETSSILWWRARAIERRAWRVQVQFLIDVGRVWHLDKYRRLHLDRLTELAQGNLNSY